MKHLKIAALGLAGSVVLAGCADDPVVLLDTKEPVPALAIARAGGANSASMVSPDAEIAAQMRSINEGLEADGAPIRVGFAELMLAPDGALDAQTTVLADDRTKHLATRFVPGDARRDADGNNITYLVDESRSVAFTRQSPADPGQQYNFAEELAGTFAPWSALACTSLNIVRRADTGADPSIADDGVGEWWLADIVEAGFIGLSPGVLGVTFTYWFVDDAGAPTDIDGDGRYDTALKEIWYSNGYWWATHGGPGAVDLPSVAIHENGHALEIGHFGKLFVTNSNGKLHFAPRAIMNAAYVEPDPTLRGTDVASFCSNFATWPN